MANEAETKNKPSIAVLKYKGEITVLEVPDDQPKLSFHDHDQHTKLSETE